MRDLRSRIDPAFVVPFAVFLLVMRAPGGTVLLGVVGAGLLLWRGVRAVPVGGLIGAYAVCAATAALASILADDHNATNYVWPAVCFGLFSAAVLWTGDVRDNVRGIITGMVAGFSTALAIACFEILTGLRLLTIGQESNKKLQQSLLEGRFRTGAIYTNYNDLSVALTILTLILVGRLLFGSKRNPVTTTIHVVVAAAASSLVVLMGSRGSLAGLLLGLLVIVLLASRAASPRVWTNLRVGAILAVAGGLVAYVWTSPYVQDHSTAIRERILQSAIHLMDLEPMTWLLGFSSELRYAEHAAALYGNELMNPHNLILELLLNYGVVGLAAAAKAWFVLVVRGLSVSAPLHWALPTFTVAALVIPVLGLVPSTTLPYGFIQLLVLGLAGSILARRRPSASALAATREPAQGDHGPEAGDPTDHGREDIGLDQGASHR